MAAEKKTAKSKKTVKKEDTKSTTMMMGGDQNATLLTEEGYKQLVDELNMLRDVRRKEVAARIKEAISYGDLSENSEYEEAKNEQAFVEGRILELEEKVKHAKIIKSNKAAVIQLGATVTIVDQETKQESVYKIVGSTEADPMAGKISNESPVGQELLEKKVGDTVEVVIPRGTVTYKIKGLTW